MLTFPQIVQSGPGITGELQNMGFPAVLKYLRDRGVPASMLDDLGIHILPAAEVIGRSRGVATSDDRLAIIFPHFNVAGDYIDWWSARLVDTGLRPVVHSIANLVPHKRGKMYCPPNEAPHAYLPPILEWPALQRGDRVYIHESCIKAINGARLGRYSVGLNGVWGWGSKKHSLGLVQELKDLPWKALELNPVIVFDSNAADNWDVQAAIGQLAARLLEITGRTTRHILLPKREDGTHQGFDDFCVEQGDERALQFLDGDGAEVEISEVGRLKIQLNAEVCVVRSMGRIAEQETGALMTRMTFTDVNYAHYTAHVEDKVINVPKLWLADAKRVEVEALDYMPGSPRIVDSRLNLWRGMGIEPRMGDVSRWLNLLERNVPDAVLREWIMKWFAFPLQNLGQKLNTFLHLYGPPGSGKQAILYPLQLAYGENFVKVGKRELTSDFNSIYANRQFINFDELQASDTSDIANQKLKMLTTDTDFTVNMKGQPEYKVRNCANICTTGNYADSIKLDDDDRRACVVRFGVRGAAHDEVWWTEYYAWMDNGGAEAVYDYLLRVDLTDFNPKGWAPMTEEKKDVTMASRSPVEQWVQSLWADPDSVLAPNLARRALFSNDELAMYAFADDPVGVTPGKKNMLGIRMNSAGFEKIQLKVGGKPVRFWIVRGRDEGWTTETARAHLKKHSFPGA